MAFTRIGTAIENMTSGHRGIPQGSAFCWLYKAFRDGCPERGIAPLPEIARIVEVGNGGLHSLGYLCDVARPGWAIYAVDPYEGDGRFLEFMRTSLTHLENVIDRVAFMRARSPEIARYFPDGSLDVVLIDGDHSYEATKADIVAWRRKVRPGGWLAGDDCDPMFPGCEQAWSEAFPDLVCYGSTAIVQRGSDEQAVF